MDYNEILNIKDQIFWYLSKNEVKDAIWKLRFLAESLRVSKASEKISEIETAYRYMLNYQFDGMQDPEREALFSGMMRSLYEMAEDLSDERISIDSPNVFYEKYRLEKHRENQSLSDYRASLKEQEGALRLAELLTDGDDKLSKMKQIAVKKERISTNMFDSIFSRSRISDEQQTEYIEFVKDEEISTIDRCLFVSALTLNLLHRFDQRKMSVLLSACLSEMSALRARAVVGLIFVLIKHDNRMEFYPECEKELQSFIENDSFRKFFDTVLIQLIRSKETESISRKMNDEIIPEMMKLSSKIGKKLSIEDLNTEIDISDKNPEWKKDLESSGLANKLQEYSELHLEGADVFHSTFANLKSFPFFSELSNWFLPFDGSYSQLIDLTSGNPNNLLLTAISKSAYMCDSDKYSFCLSLLQIPHQQHQMIAAKLKEESGELEKLQKEEMIFNPNISDEILSNQYIQNLYRFFKLYPRRGNFNDIFRFSANFYQYKTLKPLILRPQLMNKLAMYCFDKNHFAEAEAIYNQIVDSAQDANSETWQKLGYCRQMLNDLKGAVEAYSQAETLNSNNSWIVKRLAHCYRLMKNPEKAVEYFLQAEQLQPENMGIQMNIGHCYLEMEDYEQALNRYFKVEFSDSNNKKPQRPIAWTALLAGKFDLSENYYEQLIADKPSLHDYLNLGHIYLCTNRMKQAVESYVSSMKLAGGYDAFKKHFMEDEEILLKNKVDSAIFPRLFDHIQYRMES